MTDIHPTSVVLSDGTTATVGSRVRATLELTATATAYHARYRDEAGDLARKRIALARDGCVVAELTTSACGPWTIVAVRLSDGARRARAPVEPGGGAVTHTSDERELLRALEAAEYGRRHDGFPWAIRPRGRAWQTIKRLVARGLMRHEDLMSDYDDESIWCGAIITEAGEVEARRLRSECRCASCRQDEESSLESAP